MAGCGGFLPTPGWTVDVANADRPLIVSIATDRAAWMWLVAPGEHVVLLREAEALQGSIELIDPEECVLYDRASLQSTSFRIVPVLLAGEARDYRLDLVAGGPVPGPTSANYTFHCSG